ncbi:glutamine amidotransferase [Wenzhouxiangella sp. XN201]|uniref:glutamine amidotransferase n=1 Tax=Wenzhouxiangella sp. XN201 TaxID=2710755 RepID=UPI0013CCB5EC|nr:glutamine amidotransferase [Wenzhouxiangella sp. XN201]NEZ04363.1 glutamine amidotransferase [Wenzhouxiangella sp. XN201]
MSLPRMLIVKTGSAVAEARERFGDFEHWFHRALDRERYDIDTRTVCENPTLPEPDQLEEYAGVIVTGSPAMVSHRHDWSERTGEWLRAVITKDRLPVLGVCYGHQLIAHALGGRVGPNPDGRRMGTRRFDVEDPGDDLLSVLSPYAAVHVTHLEVVLEPPSTACGLGRTEGDPHHALRFGHRSWGVQFHPEFDAAIMRCYVQARAELLEGEGIDSRAIVDAVEETSSGIRLLRRFADLCGATGDQDHGESR